MGHLITLVTVVYKNTTKKEDPRGSITTKDKDHTFPNVKGKIGLQ